MKTDVEIRQDIFRVIMASELPEAISGDVRIIPRDEHSHAEDCIISVLDGMLGQIQDAAVNVNLYVPDITNGGANVEDISRTNPLAKLCLEILGTSENARHGDSFRFFVQKQRILPVNGKDEHVINNKIKYNQVNE